MKNAPWVLAYSLFAVGCLYVMEQVIDADFFTKTFWKIFLLLIVPTVWSLFARHMSIGRLFGFRGLALRSLIPGLIVGAGSFLIVFAGYILLGPFVDFHSITSLLETHVGVTAKNLILVGLYVVFVNSLLEEFFFRGFIFLNLKQAGSRPLAYGYSAGLFALYHVTIIDGWFNPLLFAVALASLFVIGIVYSYLNEKAGHFLNSWIAHALADSAIILIGLRVFGIL